MNEEYISNPEYETYYQTLGGLRSRIVQDLPLEPGMHILDLATGSAFFAIEVLRCQPNLKVTGIEVSRNGVRTAKKNIKREGLQDRIEIREMDGTRMSFPDAYFDMVVNFMGLEDIHMTRGRDGVRRAFLEVSRVLKPDSRFCFVVMPPEEMETGAQKIEVALYSYICDATWLSSNEYEEMLDAAGFKLLERRSYHTGKKLTPEQAKAEIEYACKNVPQFYGLSTPSFDEVWARFGQDIEENGLGQCSKSVLMIAHKVGAAQ